MRHKIFKYGCFRPLTTWGSWEKLKFKTEEEVFNFILEKSHTIIPVHCAICYYYDENINHDEMYVLKYKDGIYGG